ncbi:MAG TPA: protein kinase [Vicinamibacterales bacterium]|nr:protein kinase [Vicinamibacterales bacterium]
MIGETVSHYRILAEIGAGGMGVVYKAEDLRLGRFVALKFLPPQLVRDDDAKRRLFAEARAASALDHANVCTIYDVEELPDGRAFLAMAFCDGETLTARLERGAVPAGEAARLALQIAHGLARAHQAGIVHRDVKPGNIMVTREGEAKILDFGIAKAAGGPDLTRTGTTVGTIAYMAPEHIRGGPADEQSDVWALGVVLYEMLAGRRLFSGSDNFELLQAIVERPLPPLQSPGVSAELTGIVSRALDRDRGKRYAHASEMAQALEQYLQHTTTGTVTDGAVVRGRSRSRAIVAAVLVIAGGLAGFWVWRSSGARSARQAALPEALRLADLDRYGEAFVLATSAERAIAGDSVLASLWPRISRTITITTSPDGADVSFSVIGGDGTWHPLGRTPLTNVRVPRGVFRWRVEKPGFDTLDIVRSTEAVVLLPGLQDGLVLAPSGATPAGMVPVSVPAAGLRITITGFDYNTSVPAPSYFIDAREVTNAEFKAFVDAGGYEKRDFWTEPFVRNGQPLDWTTAMTIFRDHTGRPGPATWQGGAPPAGQEQHPVTGVSWYEAAAYAAFRGKRLPTIHHWSHAARPDLGDAITRTSNFGGAGPQPASASRGLGPYGTVDMAGNVKEWAWNDTGSGTRYLLGGGWNEPDYQFLYSDSRSPFDRSDTNGFRCMADGERPAPPALASAIAPPSRNYAAERPVADAVFKIYADQYVYDRTPLESRIERTDDAKPHWRHEVVTIAAAYGGERLPIHLFLPKNVKPPFQTVLLFPGSGVIRSPSSANLTPETAGIDFVPMSGRAVAFPVYKYTFERADPKVTSSWAVPTRAYTTWIQQVVMDARRTLDYLETRPDMDSGRLAYYGVSWGARLAPITIALDSRIKAGVLLMGGFGSTAPAPEADPFNFAPRVRVPILMLNGDEDFIFPLQTLQRPLFDGLGTPAADKRHVLFPGGHEIGATKRSQVIAEIVGWLDKYLGRVH